MYRYRTLENVILDIDGVITDPNDRELPFSIYVLLRVSKMFLVIVRDFYLSKGL